MASIRLNALAALAGVASVAAQSPTPTHPCGKVSQQWSAQKPIVDAALALECLTSVPIYKEAALKFIDDTVPYLEWQSDQAYKKNPPTGYFYPGYDIFGELAEVRAKIAADEYKTEHAWQSDLFTRVIGPGHDGHMYIYPDLLDTVHWQRELSLVSVSEDGLSLPVIKVYEDVVGNVSDASVVTHINGKDAASYIQDWINPVGENQDRDANYNMMFYSVAQEAVYNTRGNYQSGGRPRFVYPGDSTTLMFQNGSTVEIRNSAKLRGDWSGIVDATSLMQKLCPVALDPNAEPPSSPDAASTSPSKIDRRRNSAVTKRQVQVWPGYPLAELVSMDKSASGYFLSGEGLDDVAVLVLTSFGFIAFEAQAIVEQFYAQAVKAGKKKLVVDLQVNEGGFTWFAYDMFRQLFPDIVQDIPSRLRLSSGARAVSKAAAEICKDFDLAAAEEEEDDDLVLTCLNSLNYGYDLDENLQHFTSYEQKFAPHEFNGDKYTNLSQVDVGNVAESSSPYYGFGMNITGYGHRTNFTRPFAGPADIVIVYDGYCGSACTIFSQAMIHDAGVKTISFGGRPNKNLTQGVGGVKGSQAASFNDIKGYVDRASRKLAELGKNSTKTDSEFARYTKYPIKRSGGGGINLRDAILPAHKADGTPSQFVAEYSDCRLFWTDDMIRSPEAIWRAAARAAFRGDKCAVGGFDRFT